MSAQLIGVLIVFLVFGAAVAAASYVFALTAEPNPGDAGASRARQSADGSTS
jgi:hypothetical protein